MVGSLIQDKDQKSDPLGLVKCDIQQCNHFFRRSCLDKMKKEYPFIHQESDLLICPSHYCHECQEPFEVEDDFTSCVKCLKSYHCFKEPTSLEQLNDEDEEEQNIKTNQCF